MGRTDFTTQICLLDSFGTDAVLRGRSQSAGSELMCGNRKYHQGEEGKAGERRREAALQELNGFPA